MGIFLIFTLHVSQLLKLCYFVLEEDYSGAKHLAGILKYSHCFGNITLKLFVFLASHLTR